jgi:hypothetical protein
MPFESLHKKGKIKKISSFINEFKIMNLVRKKLAKASNKFFKSHKNIKVFFNKCDYFSIKFKTDKYIYY